LGTDQTISDEVLAAASEGLRRCGVEVGSVGGEDYRRHIARGALLAAAPHIEAAIRQAIAAEIEAEGRTVVGMLCQETEKDRWRLIGAEDAYKDSIRIALGGSR
jgi:hypothetical protein